MSYSISGIRIDNFNLKDTNQHLAKMKEIAYIKGNEKINNLIDILLMTYMHSSDKDAKLNLSYFFDFYNDHIPNGLCFQSNESNIKDTFIQFLNENIVNEEVHFYFLPNKDYCLVKINNNDIRSTLTEQNKNYIAYSMSTSSGYSSFDSLIDKGELNADKEDMYEKVKQDWEDFTKGSFYIIEEALSKEIFDYGMHFFENIDNFLLEEEVKQRLKNVSDEFIYRYYRDLYIEMKLEEESNHTDTKSFLRWRKAFIDSPDFKENMTKYFREQVDKMSSVSVKNAFEQYYKHESMF